VSEVLHLFQCLAHGEPMREFEDVLAVADKGFKKCIHGRPGSARQVLLMDQETLEEFGIPAGRTRENITTRGVNLDGLPLGQRLRVGDALLEVTKPCTPCHQMDEICDGLQDALRGRRGILCRVLEAGVIHRGDRIELEARDSIRPQTTDDTATEIL
jgi:MOSC domain-containing protein YiiM